MATHVTAEMTTQNSYLFQQDNAIILVLVTKTNYVVLHGDFLFMNRKYKSIILNRLFSKIKPSNSKHSEIFSIHYFSISKVNLRHRHLQDRILRHHHRRRLKH